MATPTMCPYCKVKLTVSAEGIPFCRAHGRFDPHPSLVGRSAAPAGERVVAPADAGRQLDALTLRYAEQHGVGYGAALRAVQLAHPELAKAYATHLHGGRR